MKNQASLISSLLLSAVLLATIFFFAFSHKKTESEFYDNKGRLIADTSYRITKKQLRIFLKIEDSILKCYLKNLKYPAQAHEFGLESTFLLSFSIDEKKRKLYQLNIINVEINLNKNKEKGLRIFLDELERINKLCYPENGIIYQEQDKKNIYYLPFKFKINDNEEPKLLVENGYIFMQVKKKPLYESWWICPTGKPKIDTISNIPPRIPKSKIKTKKKSPAKK